MSPKLSVSEYIALTNQTLEYAYPTVEIEGEVAGFKINQGKYVFFDIKDAGASVGCFMMVYALRVPIEDGMKVIISASPKLTQWGKFSLTVRAIRPSGEGSLKKSFEILKAKLDSEGLFALDRKRLLPQSPQHIAVISSTQAAGYADFIKILNDRWGGVAVDVAHVQVQGASAPDQIIRAIKYFNEREVLPEVLVIIRGGGSADDLSAFNDELLVREIAGSRIPTLVGVGHEVDESLSDLVADKSAATPSNAAQIIVPDKYETIRSVQSSVRTLLPRMERIVSEQQTEVRALLRAILQTIDRQVDEKLAENQQSRTILAQLDPRRVLERGYALLRGDVTVGNEIQIETKQAIIKAEVRDVTSK
ncbi:exodeoxyribonuclease VII large subunit [Candidatus Saccharibacteria bacterium RIFCSPHIGHO2_01_FULL_45_15]|nr:MAG: exodeoxyribonuclease VII large subunit [Candidatus Saccharibacteria bacterium RIFCSPHIGHO2_01_FULL_45_15]OGL28976.1 MAG: exodeoxyribonuclease VII large subunit [Candidatus Saccharibacteria bacterium RIFCSPHIGHO2_02_FULL_46_12]OGL31990.1 MAG: exodeoxyribonuclease VII large subunit [Candidatus Saccharibacteria bacterium RIFCSPHIGHO2_12_FULL_44_22]